MTYVELHARSAFSFLRGASNPDELVREAVRLGIDRMALCDRDGLYGSPRLHAAAREHKLGHAIVGAELTLEDGTVLPVLAATRTGYQNLCRLITKSKLRGTKTSSCVLWQELPAYSEGLLALTGDEEGILGDPERPEALATLDRLTDAFGRENVFVEIQRHYRRGEEWRNRRIVELAAFRKLPLVATNGVLYAKPEERAVLDVFTCVRNHTHLDAAGRLLSVNAERHLKSAQQMARLFADLPEAVENTLCVAERIDFSLNNLGYKFPSFPVPEGETMNSWLRKMTMEGARFRYGTVGTKERAQIDKELALIEQLDFAGYFLIVWDIAKYCRENDILVQGRGSAANSVVCYCLQITACDPIKYDLLFERFLAEGRKVWPDIDLDLPSGNRRERVIQEVYRRYGTHGAAMTANVITYRGRNAMREIGKALNFPQDVMHRFSSLYANGDFPHTLQLRDQLQKSGLPVSHPRAEAATWLYGKIRGLPRHLGQHSGGMIICQDQLNSIVPLENAAMPCRVVAQWDKDDCEELGIIKVDLLGLGMLAAMQDAFKLCEKRGLSLSLATMPDDDAVFDLMTRADTIGTFQVESRAQMATLPRMKPKCFYDVVIEVAIVRPGPIQGDMLHPYLARREGLEAVSCIHPALEDTLRRTLGVPLFQEQLLKMAMVMADFSGGEAEELRRALSFHRSDEKMQKVCVKLRRALDKKGMAPDMAEKIVKSVQSFAAYGFPESHAISFALIAYASCWMKVYHAPEFYCALLNNQPMGFYSSATLVRDAKAREVRVRPVSVLHSDWLCTVGDDRSLRLGLCMVREMSAATGHRIVEERALRPFSSLQDFQSRVNPDKPASRVLSKIGALNGLVAHRRDGLWKVEAGCQPDDLPGLAGSCDTAPLELMNAFERMEADFSGSGVTTGPHPMALVRQDLPHVVRACDLPDVPGGQEVCIAGQVICRQRPGTAKGHVFISLEDETGVSNAIVYSPVFERLRLVITQERFLSIRGVVQNSRDTIMVITRDVEALPYEQCATPKSYDFH